MLDYKDRLARAKGHTISIRQLADALGVSYQAIKKVLDGKSSALTAENNAKAARYLRVNPDWLATGFGSQIVAVTPPELTSQKIYGSNIERIDNIPAIPLISWVQAGNLTEVFTDNLHGEYAQWVTPRECKTSPTSFALRVAGSSMTSSDPEAAHSFPEGTILIVDPERQCDAGDFVIALDAHTNQATFKRLAFDGGRWYLKPLNASYKTVEIDGPALNIIGRVVESQRVCKL